MTSLTARFAQPAVGPQAGLSKTKDCTLTGTFRGVSPPLADLWIVYGTATGAPATFADLGMPQTYRLEEMYSAQFNYNGSTNDGTFSVPQLHADGSATPGDQVYVCLFSKSSGLSAGDVPLAVFADGVVTA